MLGKACYIRVQASAFASKLCFQAHHAFYALGLHIQIHDRTHSIATHDNLEHRSGGQVQQQQTTCTFFYKQMFSSTFSLALRDIRLNCSSLRSLLLLHILFESLDFTILRHIKKYSHTSRNKKRICLLMF